jgi:DNA repair exonuclease SbcCD nuclease subunit
LLLTLWNSFTDKPTLSWHNYFSAYPLEPVLEVPLKFVHTADTHLGFEFTKMCQCHPLGPIGLIFRPGRSDTVSRHTIPLYFEYVAAGHIHRYQILTHPMKPALQFVYPGSTQRMSFAEMYEEKGFVEGELMKDRIETHFLPLPTYDMEMVEIETADRTGAECENDIRDQFWRLRDDLVIRFNPAGGTKRGDYPVIDFDRIRAEMPEAVECHFAIKAGTKWILK